MKIVDEIEKKRRKKETCDRHDTYRWICLVYKPFYKMQLAYRPKPLHI